MTVNYFHNKISNVKKLHHNNLDENKFEVIIISSISKLAAGKVKDGMTVSLGGGHNVMNLAQELSKSTFTNTTLFSPSELTRQSCQNLGLTVHPLDEVNHIDLAFDGCDSVDFNFNALKSGGGIHLFEKIAAQMSDEYILLLPEERIQKQLSAKVPLCLEVAEPAANKILTKCRQLNLKASIRLGEKVAAFARSPQGNLLIDIYADSWEKIDQINDQLSKENGVIASSYFANLVTSLITEKDQEAIEIKKGDLK